MRDKIELRADQTIVFIGDSITDAGRRKRTYRPFGFGYVHFAANLLLAKHLDLNISIINAGAGGNTIRDLKHRWESDCLAHRPDILSVLIGINDLWRRFAGPVKLPYAVSRQEYELTYRQLLLQAKERCDCQIVLMEPFMFCDSPENEMFAELPAYIQIVHALANEFDAVLVALQNRIDLQIKRVPPERWANDSVHPYVWAHAWIANCWLEATGL